MTPQTALYSVGMFEALDGVIRTNQRRLAMLAFVLFLAGAVAATHSEIADDHMGDATAMCLAVLETGALALLSFFTMRTRACRPRPLLVFAIAPEPAIQRPRHSRQARAGPVTLQVFRR